MARLGRQRLSKGQLFLIGLLALLFGMLIWQVNRPLPEYLIASAPVNYGTEISSLTFSTVNLDLGSSADKYLQAKDVISGQRVIRAIGAGELIPLSTLAGNLPSGKVLVSIQPGSAGSTEITPGTEVQIWLVELLAHTQPSDPELLGLGEVTRVEKPEGLFASDFGSYEILVPQDLAPRIFKAQAAQSPIYLALAGS